MNTVTKNIISLSKAGMTKPEIAVAIGRERDFRTLCPDSGYNYWYSMAKWLGATHQECVRFGLDQDNNDRGLLRIFPPHDQLKMFRYR